MERRNQIHRFSIQNNVPVLKSQHLPALVRYCVSDIILETPTCSKLLIRCCYVFDSYLQWWLLYIKQQLNWNYDWQLCICTPTIAVEYSFAWNCICSTIGNGTKSITFFQYMFFNQAYKLIRLCMTYHFLHVASLQWRPELIMHVYNSYHCLLIHLPCKISKSYMQCYDNGKQQQFLFRV